VKDFDEFNSRLGSICEAQLGATKSYFGEAA
jgi:hypothetical protein